MKKNIISLAIVALFVTNVNAECIMRSSSTTSQDGMLDDVADVRTLVSPTFNNERKCSVNMRLKYKNKWYTAFGEYTGNPNLGNEKLCMLAVRRGGEQFLASNEVKMLHNEQQMFCTDEPEITVRPVQVGEKIRVSEVAPHPIQKAPFLYKGAECFWFVESSMKADKLHQWQGILCKTGRPNSDEWTVVDKF